MLQILAEDAVSEEENYRSHKFRVLYRASTILTNKNHFCTIYVNYTRVYFIVQLSGLTVCICLK